MDRALGYILISVLGGGVGQVLLKKGMGALGPQTITMNNMSGNLLAMVASPFVIGGLAVYGLSTVFWLTALSRVDLSFAYPFVSLSYIVMLLASWFLFGENISWVRLMGTAIVLMGVIIISRTS